MKLIFECGSDGHHLSLMPVCDVPEILLREERSQSLDLPHVSENDLIRHYTALSKRVHGVCDGFYPLGSCTMKYNPKINEEMASLSGFTAVHPLQPESTVQGCLEVLYKAEKYLCEITGMDAMTLQPAAGAQGELTGMMLIKAYLHDRKEISRTKIIIPDSAHGTNPASAAMAGFTVINVKSGPDGGVDLASLKEAVGPDTAGLMLTNPNTVGIFDKNILEITRIVHEAGGLCYYDGANLNAIAGVVRPGDMGFDIVHLNLHKTFSTPHGGGGPGSGPVGCKEKFACFLPGPIAVHKAGYYETEIPCKSIGRMKSFNGNFLVVVRALTYILTLGRDGIPAASRQAVLNANYMMTLLKGTYDMPYNQYCMHEFVMSLDRLHQQTGVSALDIAKGLLDNGMHPPTMYFPNIVHEALLIEPTETESKETIDQAVEIFKKLYILAGTNPEALHEAPVTTPVRRLDEVGAARNPILRYNKQQ